MLRQLHRSFSRIDHRYLRNLNRQKKYDQVISDFAKVSNLNPANYRKWKSQYDYAISKIPFPAQLIEPSISELQGTPVSAQFGNSAGYLYENRTEMKSRDLSRAEGMWASGISFPVWAALFAAVLFLKSGTAEAKSGIEIHMPTDVSLSDIQGISEVSRQEVMDIIVYLQLPEQYRNVKAQMPYRMLLTGGPSAERTLLASAIASETGIGIIFFTYYNIDSEKIEPKHISEIFEMAKANAPCIIYIENIDEFGFEEPNYYEVSPNRLLCFNQLLAELDSLQQTQDNILVLGGARSCPESICKQLKQEGRFDKEIHVIGSDLFYVAVYPRLTATQVAAIKEVFDSLDTTGHGTIDPIKIKNRMKLRGFSEESLDYKTVSDSLDAKKSDAIDLEQFIDAIHALKTYIDNCYDLLDDEWAGYITFENVRRFQNKASDTIYDEGIRRWLKLSGFNYDCQMDKAEFFISYIKLMLG